MTEDVMRHDEAGPDPVSRSGDDVSPAPYPTGREDWHPGFVSILTRGSKRPGGRPDERDQPAYFRDLNLDQVVATVVRGREDYDLVPFFYARLDDPADITYRLDVFRDLEKDRLAGVVRSFAAGMRTMRQDLLGSSALRVELERQGRFVDAVESYCAAVEGLADGLSGDDVSSEGLLRLRDFLQAYRNSTKFVSMLAEARDVKKALAEIRYCVRIKELRVTVSRYRSELDQADELLRTFDRFKQGEVKDHLVKYSDGTGLSHVEAAILSRVALLFPEEFKALSDFCVRHADYLDEVIRDFDREVQFYIAYLEHIRPLKSSGLAFCDPTVSRESKHVSATDAFDVALAHKLVGEGSPVVCNDLSLAGSERILVVTGPNQGGKTTFARMFGQLHHLASIGCPVPGSSANLLLFDGMFTHFEKEENLENRRGKLEDDLVRVRDILDVATPDSIVIMNEAFTSTTLDDARFLGRTVLERFIELDLLCVYVTFVDELTTLSDATVSVVSTMVPGHPTQRTYKLVRRPADGLAYAIAMAEHYGLSRERLRERIAR